ncbi:hypothetical protein DERP_002441 [Dermatophagoides pteronyssinus]|uniref:Uncharacterized protein n=1 Tax=Dermatophagoides pteronyssinus TaxID=6956 RepID=A0ABQ8JHR0_DERPT|nr:hypothetical protein DERP_002441 [Dermatophagoides pteronyssinus]
MKTIFRFSLSSSPNGVLNVIGKWLLELQHYYTDSWNFCCFVYDVVFRMRNKSFVKKKKKRMRPFPNRNDKETTLN